MSRMRIGIETSSLHWSRQGGVSRLLKSLLRAYRNLKERDIEFHLFHALPGHDPLYNDFPDITPYWPRQLPGRMESRHAGGSSPASF